MQQIGPERIQLLSEIIKIREILISLIREIP